MVYILLSKFFTLDHSSAINQPQIFTILPLNFLIFPSAISYSQNDDFSKPIMDQTHEMPNLVPADLQPSLKLKKIKKRCEKKQVKPQMGFYPNQEGSQQKEMQGQKTVKDKKKARQNAKRNILPNVLHQIFCFIQKRKRSGDIVQKFLNSPYTKQEDRFDIDRFYCYQRLIKQKTNNYINMKGLAELNRFQEPQCEIYSQMEQIQFLRMNRMLLKHYLNNQFVQIVLTSSRMLTETRRWHFEMKRKILESLIQSLQKL